MKRNRITRLVPTCGRVLNRNPKKRVEDFEHLTETNKTTSKFLFLFDILKHQDQHVIRVSSLSRYKPHINLLPRHHVSDLLLKSPNLFRLYKDQRGILWCGLTEPAQTLIKEEEDIIAQNTHKAAQYVTRMLMMSVDKRLPLDKIALFRRDLGMPKDFTDKWVHSYPELFKVVQPFTPVDEGEYLELVSWRPDWAITELEKTQRGITDEYDCTDYVPGLLRLAFPMKFPCKFNNPIFRHGRNMDRFQRCEYLSPYADARALEAGSHEFNKRAVAIMHELLSFTIEKRLVIRQLGSFRREFVMPQKVIRLLLKYLGIFYVSQRGRLFNVYLNEAYERRQLIEKHPLVIWKENFQKLVGFRGERGLIETYEDMQDEEDKDFSGSASEDDNGMVETEGERNFTSKLEE